MSDLGSTRVLGDLIVTGDILCDSLTDNDHTHPDATTSASGFMSGADKTKLNSLTNYTHPSGDGNLHIPATSTTNNGKFLKAGSTAGSLSWQLVNWGDVGSKPSTFPPDVHSHSYLSLTGGTLTGKLTSTSGGIEVSSGNIEIKTNAHNFIAPNNYGYMGRTTDGVADYMLWMNPSNQVIVGYNNRALKIDCDNPTVRGGHKIYHEGFRPPGSSSSESLFSKDLRDTNVLPKDRGQSLTADFRRNPTDGLGDGGSYHGILHFRPYGSGTDFSGGPAHQLGFSHNGNLWMRTGSNETWNNWKKAVFWGDDITITTATPMITLKQNTNTSGSEGRIKFLNTDESQGVQIRYNHFDGVKGPYGLHIEKLGNQTGKAYMIVEGEFATGGRAYIAANTNAITTSPSISLAVGDADTGIHWHSDGNASLYANNQQVLNWTNGHITAHKRLIANGGINRFYAHCQSVGSDYFNTAIELRETNEVGNSQSSPDYAPSLGFHWGNRAAGTIAMHSDGNFYFRAQGYTSNQYRNIYCNELRAVRAYNAVWNDYAEFFEKENLDEEFEPGDVVVWSENGVTKSNESNCSRTVGVFSDTYGHIVGGEENVSKIEDNYAKFVPVGLSGRVNVKLVGNIKIGDLITTSDIEGVAQKAINPILGTIIGKALENKEDDGISRISMLILNT